jgi:hypothetical protein
MKAIFSSLCLFLTLCAYTQDSLLDIQISKIKLNIILPENLDQMNDNHLSRFNTKITSLVTESGISGDEYSSGSFLIYPKLLINEISAVETGISNVYSASLDVTLYIKQFEQNTIFSSASITVKGFGNSKDLAISNAIQNIQVSNEKFKSFFTISKKKIIEYYNTTCNDLINKSSTLSKQNKYNEAIGLLYNIPTEVNCYNIAQESIIKYYKLYQESICASLIQKVKTKVAARDFEGALNILMQIDPSTSCKLDTDKLIDICEKNISDDVKRQRGLEMLRYKDNVDLEKRRIESSKLIAIEYFKSRPKTITYNNLLRY